MTETIRFWLHLSDARIHLRTLESGQEQVWLPRHRKAALLLAWLMGHESRSIARTELAELLWPQLPSNRGLANLRQVLHELMHGLQAHGFGGALQVTRQSLQWVSQPASGSALMGDVEVVDRHPEGAQAWLDGLDPDLWPGPDADCAVAFRDWIRSRRAALHERLARGVRPAQTAVPATGGARRLRLAAVAAVMRPGPHASPEPEELLQLEAVCRRAAQACGGRLLPATGGACVVLFGLNALGGGWRGQALRAAEMLALDGFQPGVGIAESWFLVAGDGDSAPAGLAVQWSQALALQADGGEVACDSVYGHWLYGQAVRSTPMPGRGATADAQHVLLWRPQPQHALDPVSLARALSAFGGREHELDSLLGALRTGQARLLVVEASAGWGKTRLAAECAFRIRQEGVQVQWLQARSETLATPWSALIELMGRLRLDADEELRLARALSASGQIGDHQRGSLIRLLARALDGAVLVIDDAHWLDAPTRALLDELMVRLPGLRLLVTRRPGPGRWPSQADVLLTLDRLSDDATIDILRLNQPDLPADRMRAAVAQAQGVPLLLAGAGSAGPAPADHADHIQTLCLTDPSTQLVLGAAALLGQQFARQHLDEQLGAAVVDDAVFVATGRGLILQYAHGWLGFAHPLIHSTCMDLLSGGDRKRLALMLALRLAQDGRRTRSAWLYEQAGDYPAARQQWIGAARHALSQGDVPAAASAMEQLDRIGWPASAGRAEAAVVQAQLCVLREGYGAPRIPELYIDAIKACADRQDEDAHALRFGAAYCYYVWSGGSSKRSGLSGAQTLQAAVREPVQQHMATWARGNTLFWLGRLREARPLLAEVVRRPVDRGQLKRHVQIDPWPLAASCLLWLDVLHGGQPVDAARENGLIERCAASDHSIDLVAALGVTAMARVSMGRRAGFAPEVARARRIAIDDGYGFWQLILDALAMIWRIDGATPWGREHAAALEESLAAVYPAGANLMRWLVMHAAYASGDWRYVLEVQARVWASRGHAEHRNCRADGLRLAAESWHALGDGHRAARVARDALRTARACAMAGWLARWEGRLRQLQVLDEEAAG